MYELPESMLIENRIKRYLLNSPMQDSFVGDDDGGVTFTQGNSGRLLDVSEN
jgi:hypothetical protein